MDRASDQQPPAPSLSGWSDGHALIRQPAGIRPASSRRRDPQDNPHDGVRRGSTDYCRQARRLRAVHAHRPVVLHEQLSQLKVVDLPEEDGATANSASSISIERLDTAPAVAETVEPYDTDFDVIDAAPDTIRDIPSADASTPPTPWTWSHGAKVGKGGVSVLTRLREKMANAAEMPATPSAENPNPALPSRDGSFADYVAERVTIPVLGYSHRLALLREAGRRGIGRFEANLVIAAVQHRLAAAPRPKASPRAGRRFIRTVAAFAVVQSLIVFGVWRLTHG